VPPSHLDAELPSWSLRDYRTQDRDLDAELILTFPGSSISSVRPAPSRPSDPAQLVFEALASCSIEIRQAVHHAEPIVGSAAGLTPDLDYDPSSYSTNRAMASPPFKRKEMRIRHHCLPVLRAVEASRLPQAARHV